MVVAAKFHGFFEYLHPFRDGNGRTGRLMSNVILLKAKRPLLVIKKDDRPEYIAALKAIKKEGTDENLVYFFFKAAMNQMNEVIMQKRENTWRGTLNFVF
jgi:Fic family protein